MLVIYKIIFMLFIIFNAIILSSCDSSSPFEPETGFYPFGSRIPEQGTIWFYNYYDYDLSYDHDGKFDEFWSKGTFKIEITSSSANSQPPFFTIEKTATIDTANHEYTERVDLNGLWDYIFRSKVETDFEQKYQCKLVLVNDSLYYEIEGQKKLFSTSLILPGTSINALLFYGRDVYLKAFSEYGKGNFSYAVELEKGKGITRIEYYDYWLGIGGYKKSFSCNLIEYIPGRN